MRLSSNELQHFDGCECRSHPLISPHKADWFCRFCQLVLETSIFHHVETLEDQRGVQLHVVTALWKHFMHLEIHVFIKVAWLPARDQTKKGKKNLSLFFFSFHAFLWRFHLEETLHLASAQPQPGGQRFSINTLDEKNISRPGATTAMLTEELLLLPWNQSSFEGNQAWCCWLI